MLFTPRRAPHTDERVIVSLTSYQPRFSTLHICLSSLLKQSIRPYKITLWIAKAEYSLLPKRVINLCKGKIEIALCDDIKSYKKIIYTAQRYPDHIIVTCDDDIIYPSNWLDSLIFENKRDPEAIVCHRARYMTFDPNANLNPYWLWPNLNREHKSILVFPVGVGGVLYPPNCFYKDLYNSEKFLSLSPHGDDIWLKAMTLLKHRKCLKSKAFKKNFKQIKGSQVDALKSSNIAYRNDMQIEKTFREYNILDLIRNTFKPEQASNDI